MDIDAFSVTRRTRWQRLEELTARRRLHGDEADELVSLYRATAADLSWVRSNAPDPAVVSYLSTVVAGARGVLTGHRSTARGWGLGHFFMVAMPRALYSIRYLTLAFSLIFVAIAVAEGVWVVHHPEALNAMGSPSMREEYATHAFSDYYSNQPAEIFGSLVWTNNARLAAIAVAGGFTGIVPAMMLVNNALSLGQAGAVMAEFDRMDQFFMLILPHGLLEITCLVVACSAGCHMFWRILVPGPLPRSRALAEEGRSLITVAVAMTIALGVAGILESYVTPADMPWAIKGTLGAVAWLSLWAYTLVLGRRAVLLGESGDIDPEDLSYEVPVSAA